jgi:hypothetical protein
MNPKDVLKRIGSVSAAAAALLVTASTGSEARLPTAPPVSAAALTSPNQPVAKLLLAPTPGHVSLTGHSSHSSHYSHRSSSTGDGGPGHASHSSHYSHVSSRM